MFDELGEKFVQCFVIEEMLILIVLNVVASFNKMIREKLLLDLIIISVNKYIFITLF